MIRLLLYGLLAVGAIWAIFRVLSLISKYRNRLTAGEVADAIEKHIDGKDGRWDWDYFTSIPIPDGHLDAIRLRCIDLDMHPPEQRNQQLRKVVEDLRNEIGPREPGKPGESLLHRKVRLFYRRITRAVQNKIESTFKGCPTRQACFCSLIASQF